MKYFPQNTASRYFTKLPQDINLTGDYELALVEIQFGNSYSNIQKDSCFFVYSPSEESDVGLKVCLPAGLYEDNDFFTRTLNSMSAKKLGTCAKNKKRVGFYYNKASRKTSVTVAEKGASLQLSPSLQRILGMDQSVINSGHHPAQYITDINEGIKSLYIYCDLVLPRQVGDVMAPLLRIVPLKDRESQMAHYIFEKPHYIPMSRIQFNTLEMLLTNDKGVPVSFSSGSTIATLHLRRRRPDLY